MSLQTMIKYVGHLEEVTLCVSISKRANYPLQIGEEFTLVLGVTNGGYTPLSHVVWHFWDSSPVKGAFEFQVPLGIRAGKTGRGGTGTILHSLQWVKEMYLFPSDLGHGWQVVAGSEFFMPIRARCTRQIVDGQESMMSCQISAQQGDLVPVLTVKPKGCLVSDVATCGYV